MHDIHRLRLTLSDEAIQGLRRYMLTPQNPPPLPQYEWDGATAHLIQPPTTRHYLLPPDYVFGAPHPLQGISSSLAIISLTAPLNCWIDNRPAHVIREHQLQSQPPPLQLSDSLASARQYLQLYSRPTYRAHWHDLFDDPSLRSRHELKLTPYSRAYYYNLAILHKMAPWFRGGRNPQAAYVSAAVEAIGLSYLITPQERDQDTNDDDC